MRAWRWMPPGGGRLALLAAAAGLSGVGHGAVALCAGLLGRALVQPAGASPLGWTVDEVAYVGLAATTVKAAGSILLAFSEARSSAELGCALRERIVARVAARGVEANVPRVLATVTVRLREVESALVQGAIASLRALAQLAPILVGVIFVSPLLAVVGTFLLLPFAVGLAALRRRWRGASSDSQARAEALHTGVDELIRNLDLWRCYGATQRISAEIAAVGREASRASARVEVARAALSGSNEVLGALALVGALAVAQRASLDLGDGTLVAFAAMCFMAYRPLRDLGDARAWNTRGMVALEALEPLLEEPLEPRASTPDAIARHASVSPSTLELRAVGVESRGPRTSLVLAAGEIVAVVGPTGSGKTTLLRALLGLEPATGSMRYAGVDLASRPAGPTGRPFAWVPQDAPLITGSVVENVALFSGDHAGARRALGEIGARGLLERGDEIVGPGGRPLSGGERRLVSIARALATELPILLLDEPAEGLDAESRRRVLEALERLRGRRSVILVTHHDEVAMLADRVVPIGAHESAVLAAE